MHNYDIVYCFCGERYDPAMQEDNTCFCGGRLLTYFEHLVHSCFTTLCISCLNLWSIRPECCIHSRLSLIAEKTQLIVLTSSLNKWRCTHFYIWLPSGLSHAYFSMNWFGDILHFRNPFECLPAGTFQPLLGWLLWSYFIFFIVYITV